jgi:hypothetical protein
MTIDTTDTKDHDRWGGAGVYRVFIGIMLKQDYSGHPTYNISLEEPDTKG